MAEYLLLAAQTITFYSRQREAEKNNNGTFPRWLEVDEDDLQHINIHELNLLINGFADDCIEEASTIISNGIINGQLKHHDMDNMSFPDPSSFKRVTGVEVDTFSRILISILPALHEAFPNSKVANVDSFGKVCSLRMRLFLFMFRVKTGTSFRCMEVLFGWSASSIKESFAVVLKLLKELYYDFHDGILTYLGLAWQMESMQKWVLKTGDNIQAYIERIQIESRSNGIVQEEFVGSLGSVDGTFSYRPRTFATCKQGDEKDPMYSGYCKKHCYKVLVLTSHGINIPQLILGTQVGCGAASDANLHIQLMNNIKGLHPQASFHGDHAFHSSFHVITPYLSTEMVGRIEVLCRIFNTTHSGSRISSEHGIDILKAFAMIRGRSDIRLVERHGDFEDIVKVCTALHNYECLGCPMME